MRGVNKSKLGDQVYGIELRGGYSSISSGGKEIAASSRNKAIKGMRGVSRPNVNLSEGKGRGGNRKLGEGCHQSTPAVVPT